MPTTNGRKASEAQIANRWKNSEINTVFSPSECQEMKLNEMGEIVRKYWMEIPQHFPDTWLDEYIVMPNHIHGIVVMKRSHKNDHPTHPDTGQRNDNLEHGGISERRDVALQRLYMPYNIPENMIYFLCCLCINEF